jgi:hypothetical protein
MKFKYIGYAALATVATAALVLGTAGSSEAAKKKAMAEPHPAPCFEPNMPVCGAKGGMKFTYANSCYAGKDGATVVADKACPAPKATKAGKKGGGKAMAKPAKKKAMKKK